MDKELKSQAINTVYRMVELTKGQMDGNDIFRLGLFFGECDKPLALNVALTIHPRVVSQDAGGEQNIPADVVIERFLTGTLSRSIVDDCRFSLSVVREGNLEMSTICLDMGELEDALIADVHGGRELFHGKHWMSY
jgi:hypothetical protein